MRAYARGTGKSTRREYVCDADGQATVDLPKNVSYVGLELSKDGYLRLSTAWRFDWTPTGTPIPQHANIELTKLSAEQAKALAELQHLGGDCTVELRQNDHSRRVMAEVAGEGLTDAALAPLCRLPDLDELEIISPDAAGLTDAGLEYLEGLHSLKTLALNCTKVTDAGLVHLRRLRALEKLTLVCVVTEDGLKHLTPLKELSTLIVYHFPVDRATWRILEKLDEDTSLEVDQASLLHVCDYLSDLHGTKLQFDELALKTGKLDKETPVTCNIQHLPFCVALDKLLSPLGLGWIVERGAVIITTRDAVTKKHPELRKLQQALPKLRYTIVITASGVGRAGGFGLSSTNSVMPKPGFDSNFSGGGPPL
jgi:hypothetical protein